jgi:hypothetical protein
VGPEVSGVGYYSTSVDLPADWKTESGRIVLKLESTCGGSAAVYVNGEKGRAVDFDAPEVDITELLCPGRNEIRVEVSSSLNNRLLARGYFADVPKISKMLSDGANNGFVGDQTAADEEFARKFSIQTSVKDYGLVGKAELLLMK